MYCQTAFSQEPGLRSTPACASSRGAGEDKAFSRVPPFTVLAVPSGRVSSSHRRWPIQVGLARGVGHACAGACGRARAVLSAMCAPRSRQKMLSMFESPIHRGPGSHAHGARVSASLQRPRGTATFCAGIRVDVAGCGVAHRNRHELRTGKMRCIC